MRVPLLRATRDTIRYGFASGKARVLETRVFGRSTYERLLDAPAFADQKRILSDTPYGRYIEGVETADGVERAMGEALDGFYDFLAEAELPEPVVRFFRVRHDFAAMRAAWKARVLGVPCERPPVSLGTVDATRFDAEPGSWPEPFGGIVAGVEPGPDGKVELAAIDEAVDRALFTELALCAKDSRSDFLRGLVQALADTANARVLVRARLAGRSAREVEHLLVPGGSLKPAALLELFPLPPAEIASRLSQMPALSGMLAADLADIARLDVASDDLVVRYLKKARAVPVGAEPVIAYVLAREAEVSTVRTLLVGKLAGLSAELLRVRLRDSYAGAR